jgi:hypothetical protein
MTATYSEARQAALESLETGNALDAFQKFRWTMEYPGELGDDDARWRDALTVFAAIAAGLGGEAFAAPVKQAADDPSDAKALYDLGYWMIDQDLSGIAATVLARANLLVPDHESILTELVCALERGLRFHEACHFLRAAPGLVEQSFVCRYLLAWNALMTGDLSEPRQLLPGLDPGDNADFAAMKDRIAGMLSRADAVREVTPLNGTDLRGWHFVLTGGLLLHLSPYGFEDGMHGRYAFVQDDAGRCLEGIRRLAGVFEAWSVRPPRVFLLPDPDSASLGLATAEVLGLPGEPWPADGMAEPGLIVAYDLSALDETLLGQLAEHRPGQIVWAHASPWTAEPPFAADLTTYLYQQNVSAWGERMRINPDTQDVETMPADTRPPPERASDIVAASLDAETLKDMPVLADLATAARHVTGGAGPGAVRTEGVRRRQPVGSPVPSSRFM